LRRPDVPNPTFVAMKFATTWGLLSCASCFYLIAAARAWATIPVGWYFVPIMWFVPIPLGVAAMLSSLFPLVVKIEIDGAQTPYHAGRGLAEFLASAIAAASVFGAMFAFWAVFDRKRIADTDFLFVARCMASTYTLCGLAASLESIPQGVLVHINIGEPLPPFRRVAAAE